MLKNQATFNGYIGCFYLPF